MARISIRAIRRAPIAARFHPDQGGRRPRARFALPVVLPLSLGALGAAAGTAAGTAACPPRFSVATKPVRGSSGAGAIVNTSVLRLRFLSLQGGSKEAMSLWRVRMDHAPAAAAPSAPPGTPARDPNLPTAEEELLSGEERQAAIYARLMAEMDSQ